MLQIARDPERGAGEFLAMGPFQLWRKPAVHLELEEAFRLFLARRPDEARTRWQRLSRKYQGKEAEPYKLSVLAEAFIAELSGDLAAASSILEELGKERGFATDRDRILALARVSEQLGKRDDLEKAVHICEYLERTVEKISVLGRLSSLYRALGKDEEAAVAAERFLSLFRRRMHRPVFADAVESASRRYVPLEKLRAARFGESRALGDGTTPRQAAIALALEGQDEKAAELFRAGGTALDLRYLGDVEAGRGHLEEAARLYIRSLGGEPDDSKARKVLEAALRAAPRRPSLWTYLATLHGLHGRKEDATRCDARAALLADSAARRSAVPGRVYAAAVYHFVGKAKGLIHEVWAGRRPVTTGRGGHLGEILGNLTPEMAQCVRNTFVSVREYAAAKLPHLTHDLLDYDYSYKVTKEDEPSGGLSAGLPTALRREVLASPRVPAVVSLELVRFVSDLDEAVPLVFGEEIWGA